MMLENRRVNVFVGSTRADGGELEIVAHDLM